MGQYLAIGLVTKISVKKIEVDKAKLNLTQLQDKMKQELHYVPEIYVVSDDDDFYHFILKEEIFQTQLIPFLNTIYPLLYDNSVYYDSVIQKLKTLSPSEWHQWAEEKREEAFQFDEYGMWDYLENNHSQIRVHYTCLLLSMEGKIMMETFGRQFNFFKYTMRQTFRQFSLAGALRTYITG
ncbi:conserved hypothetical protein [Beggiatoa sp. PS]|nr:conserved hypothetical protein [Beggiatoa sp. PS]